MRKIVLVFIAMGALLALPRIVLSQAPPQGNLSIMYLDQHGTAAEIFHHLHHAARCKAQRQATSQRTASTPTRPDDP